MVTLILIRNTFTAEILLFMSLASIIIHRIKVKNKALLLDEMDDGAIESIEYCNSIGRNIDQ